MSQEVKNSIEFYSVQRKISKGDQDQFESVLECVKTAKVPGICRLANK